MTTYTIPQLTAVSGAMASTDLLETDQGAGSKKATTAQVVLGGATGAGANTIAIGNGSNVVGTNSIAIGLNASANATAVNSIAIGPNASAFTLDAVVIGVASTAEHNADGAIIVGARSTITCRATTSSPPTLRTPRRLASSRSSSCVKRKARRRTRCPCR